MVNPQDLIKRQKIFYMLIFGSGSLSAGSNKKRLKNDDSASIMFDGKVLIVQIL